MNEFPSSYEQFLKVHNKTVSEISELEFYRGNYLSIVEKLKLSIQVRFTI